ncbi:hypothetical protein QFZ96_006009 [Paraburkholderia youngii]
MTRTVVVGQHRALRRERLQVRVLATGGRSRAKRLLVVLVFHRDHENVAHRFCADHRFDVVVACGLQAGKAAVAVEVAEQFVGRHAAVPGCERALCVVERGAARHQLSKLRGDGADGARRALGRAEERAGTELGAHVVAIGIVFPRVGQIGDHILPAAVARVANGEFALGIGHRIGLAAIALAVVVEVETDLRILDVAAEHLARHLGNHAVAAATRAQARRHTDAGQQRTSAHPQHPTLVL